MTRYSLTNIDQIPMVPYSKSRLVSPMKGSSSISYYMPTGKLNGLNRYEINADPDWSATTGVNPTNEWFWHIMLVPVDPAIAQIRAAIRVDITYYAKFYRREPVTMS